MRLRHKPFLSGEGGEVGIFCHNTKGSETVIKGVALPKGKKDTTLVKMKCTKGRFKNLDTNKSVNVANVACSGSMSMSFS